jgi:iron only hydrogenase large subunit-like protein
VTAYEEFKDKFDFEAIEKTTLLCSECPGWVCYAEKVVGELAIPRMSLVKSPQ